MHTPGILSAPTVPLPHAFDPYFAPSFLFVDPGQEAKDANSDHIAGIVFPEATSAMYLRVALQILQDPTQPVGISPETLSNHIRDHIRDMTASKWRAGDRNAAVGTNLM